nr:MAG TPA: hypothetical protein [Bacteriophage sp.]
MDKIEFLIKYEQLIHNKTPHEVLREYIGYLIKSNNILKTMICVQMVTIIILMYLTLKTP